MGQLMRIRIAKPKWEQANLLPFKSKTDHEPIQQYYYPKKITK